MLEPPPRNHWINNAVTTLLPLSRASDFAEGLGEWRFIGHVIDYEDEDVKCELCHHPELRHHYQIANRHTEHSLLVGSKCILKFQEIEILSPAGRLLVDPGELRHRLQDAQNSARIEACLGPLRRLWKKDRPNDFRIRPLAEALKRGHGVDAADLALLFRKMDTHGIDYCVRQYKLKLRSMTDLHSLERLSPADRQKIWPALSAQQKKRMSR
jgi:hypothetical protein